MESSANGSSIREEAEMMGNGKEEVEERRKQAQRKASAAKSAEAEMMGNGKEEVEERRKQAQRKASAAKSEEAAEELEEPSEEAPEESEASAAKAVESARAEASAEEKEEVDKEMEKWKEQERALDALRDKIYQEARKRIDEQNKGKERSLNEKRSKKKKQKQRKKKMEAPKAEEATTAVETKAEEEEEEWIKAEKQSFMDHAKEARKMGEYKFAQHLEMRARQVKSIPKEANTDPNAYRAGLFRKNWDNAFGEYGSFDKITSIPPSCFTDHPGDSYASVQETLLIFKVKVGKIKKPLEWPLDVFGSIAVRDVIDRNRNFVFYRKRDNYQTITEKDSYLTLTGPTRAVVASVHPTHIEVDLKVKGTDESEDKDLSYLVVSSIYGGPSYRAETSKLSTVEFTYLRIDHSVEAFINVKVQSGSWPRGCGGLFIASSACFKGLEIVLLAFDGDRLPVDDDGNISLSRQVVSVEFLPPAELIVSAKALCGSEEENVSAFEGFTPKEGGRSQKKIEVGCCEMEVSVTWSLLSCCKSDYDHVHKERSDL